MSENIIICFDIFFCENDICKIVNYIWMVILLVLFVFGLIGGFLFVIVLIWIRFQIIFLLFFLFILVIIDMVILCVGFLRLWVLEIWQIDIRDLFNVGCKFFYFFVYFLMQFFLWIFVCVIVECFIKCRYMIYILMVIVKKCMILLIVIFVVLGSLNLYYFWIYGFILFEYNIIVCGVLLEYEIFDEWYIKIDFFILSVILFCIMVFLDVMILRSLKNVCVFWKILIVILYMYNKLKMVDKRLIKMLLIINLYFLLLIFLVFVLFIFIIYICRK